jgi:hypothetical protein
MPANTPVTKVIAATRCKADAKIQQLHILLFLISSNDYQAASDYWLITAEVSYITGTTRQCCLCFIISKQHSRKGVSLFKFTSAKVNVATTAVCQ